MKKTRLRDHVYLPVRAAVNQISASLIKFKISPMQLTLTGLIVNVFGCILFAHGHFSSGAMVILFAGIFDMLDGALARESKTASRFGAFVDSVVDRYSDMLIFGSLAVYFAKDARADYVLLVLIVIAGAFLTSYTKARAEGLIKHCDVGMIERPERIIIIGVGGLFGAIVPALWILAFATHMTALDRIYYTWKQTEGDKSGDEEN